MITSKTVSKTRMAMEKATTYLASGHEGRRGLDPKKVEAALWQIGNWKKWFVHFMQNNELSAAPGTGPMGKVKASEIADGIFKSYYENEVRAFEMPGMSTYWTREPGAIEFGSVEKEQNLNGNVWDNYSKDHINDQVQYVMGKCCTPKSRQKQNYGELLGMLTRCMSNSEKIKLVAKAKLFMRFKAISKEQFKMFLETSNHINGEMIVKTYLGLSAGTPG